MQQKSMIMEPNKFDKSIKDKMEARTIEPSADAWGKLEAMMPMADKSKRKYVWLYFAASFVGLLLMSSLFFNQTTSSKIDTNSLVVVKQVQTNRNLEKSTVNKDEQTLSQKGNSAIVVSESINKKEISKKEPDHLKEKEVVVFTTKEKIVNAVSVSSQTKVTEVISKNKYTSAEELLAAISDVNGNVNTNEKSLTVNRVSSSVDPNSLLSSVEKELNQAYKESALQKFNKKLNVVRTAFVNRNYQE